MIEKMGWSEKKAMVISGHKTNAMIKRYDIIPTDDIKESGSKPISGGTSNGRSAPRS